jgi:CheY-like chemotaxis protein/two-component sensor histidine kinase
MDLSLINSGNQDVYKKETDISDLINTVILKFVEACQEKHLHISLQSSSDLNEIKIITDSELLSKILCQLVDNAIKFTTQGAITIGCKKVKNNLILFVKDTGVGISEEIKNHIFEIFNQESISSSRGYEGSGIGLSIAKGFMNLLGGTITLESEKGKGSTFYLTVPFKDETVTRIPENIVKRQGLNGKTTTILIAEDDEVNFIYLEILLKFKSIKIMHAHNGLEAIEMCQNHPEICMVLMDLKMPGMDGFEATRTIKKTRSNLPVLAISAYAGRDDKLKALQSGCDDYLIKPFNNEFLFNKLKEFGLIFK